jgi:DNA-binding response OmpR family regulator
MEKQVHILIVEDDNDISGLLCNMMKKSGYVPQPAFSGTEAILYVEKKKWDMVLLDLMLPGMDGEEVLRKIREHHHVPVLIISAKGEQQTKINGLRAGADDFITKPFDIEEVMARIDAHLRRSLTMKRIEEKNQLTYRGITVDTDTKVVIVNDLKVILTAREYAILELLISYPQKIFSKANVFEAVWGDDYFRDENTVNVHMSNLRSKLAKASPNEEYIETIWGMGYRLK